MTPMRITMFILVYLTCIISSCKGFYCLKSQPYASSSRRPIMILPRIVTCENNMVSISDDKSSSTRCYTHERSQCDQQQPDDSPLWNNQRRSFLLSIGAPFAVTATIVSQHPEKACAKSGLVQFPCTNDLQNTYHFMRSGQSLLEARDILSTNPLFLTNRENALSDLGREQVEEACRYLKSDGGSPTIVGYSLAANCMDSASIAGKELNLGQNRLVPEFTFLDPRAVGKWDILPLKSTEEAIWAMDATEAGNYGIGGRPPPHDDGTPNETLMDQVTRLRQYFSVLETLYSGDTVLLIFPDGTGPALLSCLIAGIPINRVHELQFQPGEIRLDVNYENARAILSSEPSQEYTATVKRGLDQLKVLRTNPENIINVKDQAYEVERLEEIDRIREIARIRQEKINAEIALETQQNGLNNNKNEVGTVSSMSKGVIVSGMTALGIAGAASTFLVSREYVSNGTYVKGNAKEIQDIEVTNSTSSSLQGGRINDISITYSAAAYSRSDDRLLSEQGMYTDPEERAKQVMEEYLDEDDGGDAWRSMMSGMVHQGNETLLQ